METNEIDHCDSKTDAPWEGGDHLLTKALYLVADNTQAGRINGHRLAEVAPDPPFPEPRSASSMTVVVRCEARHTNERGEHKKASTFRNMRKALHLCVGARVYLTLNSIWDVSTVPLGLMNGARGVVVALLYLPPHSSRTDGHDLVGTGFPSGHTGPVSGSSGRPPRGLDACPVPNFVVVHFPDYTGWPIFENLPRTWIPVPAVEVKELAVQAIVPCGAALASLLGNDRS